VLEGHNLADIDFPPQTERCNYGFWHGFLEHYIQNRLDGSVAKDTCEYLVGRYGSVLPRFSSACYHAIGHGYMQAEADTIEKLEWGNASAIIHTPLTRCDSLPLTPFHIGECREGVFRVLADWMTLNNFGLTPQGHNAVCAAQPERWQTPCYYMFAHEEVKPGGLIPPGVVRTTDELNRLLTSCHDAFSLEHPDTCVYKIFGEYRFPRANFQDATTSLQNTNLFAPCNSVLEQYQEVCYFAQPAWWQYALNTLPRNEQFVRMHSYCALLPSTAAQYCYEGIGNVISSLSVDAGERAALCGTGAGAAYCQAFASH
jgi:hypothetical protein